MNSRFIFDVFADPMPKRPLYVEALGLVLQMNSSDHRNCRLSRFGAEAFKTLWKRPYPPSKTKHISWL